MDQEGGLFLHFYRPFSKDTLNHSASPFITMKIVYDGINDVHVHWYSVHGVIMVLLIH